MNNEKTRGNSKPCFEHGDGVELYGLQSVLRRPKKEIFCKTPPSGNY
jgi:hypothetical protein